ncbi:MAG: hypothetical protein IJZ46_02780 [Bacilli bacterium]|nr:hypothetical protein [Bacilli bacterium]
MAVENLANAVKNYNEFYADKEYDIILSNGDQISFEILNKNLCHMLGIDYKNLVSDYFTSFRENILGLNGSTNSYALLKALLENIDKVLKYDYDKGGHLLNYYRIMIKCAIFEKLSDFSRFNFGVIDFNEHIYTASSGRPYKGKTDKMFYVQSNEAVAPYFMMGVVPADAAIKQNDEEIVEIKHVVETLIAPSSPGDFFNNQEVAIPTQILVTTVDKMDKLEATPSEKIAMLNQYRSIVNEYKISNKINIFGDYESMLAQQVSKKRTRG